MQRNDILKIISKHKRELRTEYGIETLALFGSMALNEASKDSDIDFLVEFDRPIGFFHLFRAQRYLEDLMGGKKVDLVLRPNVIEELQDIIYGEAIDVPV